MTSTKRVCSICEQKRVTKRSWAKSKQAQDAARKARQAVVALQRLAERVLEARGLGADHEARCDFLAKVEKGEILLTEGEVDAEVAKYLATARIHPECREHASRYGRLAYRYDAFPKDCCESCGEPLMCLGEIRPHKFRELSMAEAAQKGMFHGGNCYHVFVCTVCGHGSASDSSG